MLNDDVKDFLKTFRILTYGNSKWQVWQDFIFMSACSFSNAVAKKKKKKKRLCKPRKRISTNNQQVQRKRQKTIP